MTAYGHWLAYVSGSLHLSNPIFFVFSMTKSHNDLSKQPFFYKMKNSASSHFKSLKP
jgi:hypothetical protein